jgi:hypothetical protein
MKRSIIVAAAAGLVASQTLPFDRIVEAVTLSPRHPHHDRSVALMPAAQ